MTMPEREVRLMETFVNLLADHQRDYEGFVRDIENVRYCQTPIDDQQLGRCEYALRNMQIRLLTINNCIHSELFQGDVLDALVDTKNTWNGLRQRVDSYLNEIRFIIDQTTAALRLSGPQSL